ncbi:hypothetical protein RFI_26833 [Reticulomyxa filosa]|uniref:Uncharacterized protein n=1 Tax=Reticulomyxa filosa TaxID=46433 RepID=X6MBX0_RETFI|nr:hypothetical protein RFI_26833 [Reticulomyxa filosa]|eukprot:ETO10545.1 hypothetical protein RFI_26833 [Reticulomyxa filosa]
MQFSLILMSMHVLNALLVMSSANTSNTSKSVTEEQTYSNYHNNIVMLVASLNKLISTTSTARGCQKHGKCAKYLQIYKLAIISFVGIFNKGLMVFENEIIRFPPVTLLINYEKIVYIKMEAMDRKIKQKKYVHTKKNCVYTKKCIHKKKFVNKKKIHCIGGWRSRSGGCDHWQLLKMMAIVEIWSLQYEPDRIANSISQQLQSSSTIATITHSNIFQLLILTLCKQHTLQITVQMSAISCNTAKLTLFFLLLSQ